MSTPQTDASAGDAPEATADGHHSPPSPATSCLTAHAGADHTCGADGTADCCGTLEVEGGSFMRFRDVSHRDLPSDYPATLSTFYLDQFEVTVGRFRAFVDGYNEGKPKSGVGASSHVPSSGWQSSWPIAADGATLKNALANDDCTESTYRTWTDVPGANERLPMNCLTWYELFAFCAWDGGRLPSVAEHMYAAAGGAEQRVYPWSTPPSSEVVDLSHALYAIDTLKPPALEAVGGRPMGRGRWGQYDLSGSVAEFVFDAAGIVPVDCVDCIQLAGFVPTKPSEARAALGGSFAGGTDVLPSRDLEYTPTDVRDRINGGRCARE